MANSVGLGGEDVEEKIESILFFSDGWKLYSYEIFNNAEDAHLLQNWANDTYKGYQFYINKITENEYAVKGVRNYNDEKGEY